VSMEWWRCKHGAPFDPKWRVVASRAGSDVRPGDVWAVFTTLCDRASQASDRGSLEGLDLEDVAAGLGYDTEQVSRIVTALKAKSLIDDERIITWVKHQPKREDEGATERKREQRAREKEAQKSATNLPSHEMSRDVTQSHSREEKIRLDTEKKDSEAKASAVASAPASEPLVLKTNLQKRSFDLGDSLGIARPAVGSMAKKSGYDWTAVHDVLSRCKATSPADPTSWCMAEFQPKAQSPPPKKPGLAERLTAKIGA
jgi:hypothetical protein